MRHKPQRKSLLLSLVAAILCGSAAGETLPLDILAFNARWAAWLAQPAPGNAGEVQPPPVGSSPPDHMTDVPLPRVRPQNPGDPAIETGSIDNNAEPDASETSSIDGAADITPTSVSPDAPAQIGADEAAALNGMASADPTAEEPQEKCLQPTEVTDGDGDFVRNQAALAKSSLCVTEKKFEERGVRWIIQTIASGRPGPLWAVPHDNENAAFDTAVYAVNRYGGSVVAVETNGKRNNGSIDPNRNFSTNGVGCRKVGTGSSPTFTRAFLRHLASGQPVVALHTNDRGSAASGGAGHVSMLTPMSNASPFRGKGPVSLFRSDDTMIFLATTKSVKTDSDVAKKIEILNAQGINVMLEKVNRKNSDCSMSNYAALAGLPDYVNLEVVHRDSSTQKKMVDVVMTSVFGASSSTAAVEASGTRAQ